MAGLEITNFLSAATGMRWLVAVIRGIARKEIKQSELLGRLDSGRFMGAVARLHFIALFLVVQGTWQS